MKKIFFITLVFIFSIFNLSATSFSDCSFDPKNDKINNGINKCLTETALVESTDAKIGGGFGTMITKWTDNIALYLGVFAVLAIAVGAIMLVFSAGEDEKITKGKNTVKWGILGFLGVISASAIINLIVKIIYSL